MAISDWSVGAVLTFHRIVVQSIVSFVDGPFSCSSEAFFDKQTDRNRDRIRFAYTRRDEVCRIAAIAPPYRITPPRGLRSGRFHEPMFLGGERMRMIMSMSDLTKQPVVHITLRGRVLELRPNWPMLPTPPEGSGIMRQLFSKKERAAHKKLRGDVESSLRRQVCGASGDAKLALFADNTAWIYLDPGIQQLATFEKIADSAVKVLAEERARMKAYLPLRSSAGRVSARNKLNAAQHTRYLEFDEPKITWKIVKYPG